MARIEIIEKATGRKQTINDWHMWRPCEKGEKRFYYKTTLGDWTFLDIDTDRYQYKLVSWIGERYIFCREDGTVGETQLIH